MYNNENVFNKINEFEEKNSELKEIIEAIKEALSDKALVIESKESWNNLPGFEEAVIYNCFDSKLSSSLKEIDNKLLMRRRRIAEIIQAETSIELVTADSKFGAHLKEGHFRIAIRKHDCASVVLSMNELEKL